MKSARATTRRLPLSPAHPIVASGPVPLQDSLQQEIRTLLPLLTAVELEVLLASANTLVSARHLGHYPRALS